MEEPSRRWVVPENVGRLGRLQMIVRRRCMANHNSFKQPIAWVQIPQNAVLSMPCPEEDRMSTSPPVIPYFYMI